VLKYRQLLSAIACVFLLAAVSQDARAAAADNPATFLDVVRRYADTMIERGRDTYGPQKTGLLLSALDRMTLSPLAARPAAPLGLRREDRVGRPWETLIGANPQLDENLLRVFYTLSEITGDARYRTVADEELAWFLKNAVSPATGLLPWGEHMSWDVLSDEPIAAGAGLSVHEFSRPWVLWDRCFEVAPEGSRRFALGLWEHQVADHKTGGFDRHAPYFKHGPVDGKDFARHGGFYIGTWCYAYKYTKDKTFLQAIETILARFERKRIQSDGSLVATIGPLDCHIAAAMLPEPLSSRLRTFAEKEDELILADMTKQGPEDYRPMWQAGYSSGTAASYTMFCLARHEQTGNPAYRDLLIKTADAYLDSIPEEDEDVWPMSFAHAISAQVAAYRWTKREVYREAACKLARMAVAMFWQDNPLPRASFKTGHYETITGSDSLALALLEVHAITHDLSVRIPSNTIDR
jgi:hypothetical protein